jgi:hypothetical protein
MQHLKEFLTRLQTFTLQLTNQKISVKAASNENLEMPGYDITRETQYYDSFSYKSELRVLKDMAFIDVLTLDKERIALQLIQLNKLNDRFKELWQNYHQHYHDYHQDYKSSYPFSIKLDTIFIVHNLQGDSADIHVSSQFVEDLADSIKLRETFLKELIRDVEAMITKKEQAPDEILNTGEETSQPKEILQSEKMPLSQEAPLPVNRYPTFKEGAANQLYNIFKPYFIAEDHAKLEKLLVNNQAPESPLVFRDNGNKLADAFKQLYDARLIRKIEPTIYKMSSGAKNRESDPNRKSLHDGIKHPPCRKANRFIAPHANPPGFITQSAFLPRWQE